MSDHAAVVVVPQGLLEALAAEAPQPAPSAPPSAKNAPERGSGYTSRLLVDRWLADRDAAFRVKPQPDGKGRTVYVLAQCPFDASHGDPDACVMQDANGKLSAQCLHNSCRGSGWQQFKEAIGAPEAGHYDPPLASRSRKKRAPARTKGDAQGAGGAVPEACPSGGGNPPDAPGASVPQRPRL